ncbi:hypothetical protein MTO96_020939 [Rhipicephalus appendiculatus]
MSQEGTGVGVRGGRASSREGASHLLSEYRATSSEGILEAGDMDKEHNTGYRTEAHVETGSNGVCTFLLTAISVFFIVLTFPLSLLMCIKNVLHRCLSSLSCRDDEERVVEFDDRLRGLTVISFFCIAVLRGGGANHALIPRSCRNMREPVIFRLGRLVKGGARGPGLFFIIPCIDNYTKVDLRTVSFDVPPQEILTKDSVTVAVDAVVYYRIQNATVAVTNVEDYGRSTRLLAATTLRNVLGTKSLSEILSEREAISHTMQANLDEATDAWGSKSRASRNMQRAMAAEAEASREARAKVIAAEGEQRAARSLKEAADVISESGPALQLRYLQTLTSIAAEKNSTIVFPLPMELLKGLLERQS